MYRRQVRRPLNHLLAIDQDQNLITCLCWFSVVAVGLVEECSSLDSAAGWMPYTWAYHSEDGFILSNNVELSSGPAYGVGKTVGMTYDPDKGVASFTLDGVRVGK